MLEIQRQASEVVRKVLSGRNHTQSLAELWRKEKNLSAQQKGAIQDLSYGVMRYLGQLQEILAQLLKTPVKNEGIQALLLVAVYQLEYSQSSKHAIVLNAVNAAKSINPHVAGMVNAVLRNFLRNRESLLQLAAKSEVGRYNHPAWWIDKLRTQHADNFESILLAGCERPPMTLRVNLKKTTLAEYLALLAKEEIDYTVLSATAVKLSRPLLISKLPGFSLGLVSVQDLGAQWAANLLDVRDGMRVLDACAAPGGKSAHLLEIADIDLLSLEVNASRIHLINENLDRLGLHAAVVEGDAEKPESWWDNKPFQRILADVPCSASGVVRRHPDIKWLRRPDDFSNFAVQQGNILTALWRTLESGGKLLYATCSVFAEENESVIDLFLQQHQDAKRLPLPEEISNGQLLPNELHDGFFYTLLQKG